MSIARADIITGDSIRGIYMKDSDNREFCTAIECEGKYIILTGINLLISHFHKVSDETHLYAVLATNLLSKALCVGRMQSFHDLADIDNLNAHATSNLYADEEVKENAELRGKSPMKTIRFSTSPLRMRRRKLGHTLAFGPLGVISRKNSDHGHPLDLHANYA